MRNTLILTLLISLAGGAIIQDLAVVSDGMNTKLIIKADAPFISATLQIGRAHV